MQLIEFSCLHHYIRSTMERDTNSRSRRFTANEVMRMFMELSDNSFDSESESGSSSNDRFRSRSSSSSESDREINRNVPALSSRLSRKADKQKGVPRKALSSPQGVFQTISHPRASALRQRTKLHSVFFLFFSHLLGIDILLSKCNITVNILITIFRGGCMYSSNGL